MQKINFTKMVASGNDFIVTTTRYPQPATRKYSVLSQRICNRKYGVGADGLLILEKSKIADIKMRVFNPDGSEAQMCGNGARCVASVIARSRRRRGNLKKCDCFAPSGLAMTIETQSGIIESEVNSNNVKIKLTEPKDIKLDISIKVNNRLLRVNFINTGVPHTVIFVEGLEKIAVANLGRQIRYHRKFKPQGTNVDFVEVINNNSLKVRTYERGVEDETLACGTGAVAAAIITTGKQANRQTGKHKINVHTKGGEILKVYFERLGNNFKNVWLEGRVKIVYSGVYYV